LTVVEPPATIDHLLNVIVELSAAFSPLHRRHATTSHRWPHLVSVAVAIVFEPPAHVSVIMGASIRRAYQPSTGNN
jgi:hypothetical protein